MAAMGAAPHHLSSSRVIVADSNRFDAPGAHAAITIVNARAALAHRSAIISNPCRISSRSVLSVTKQLVAPRWMISRARGAASP